MRAHSNKDATSSDKFAGIFNTNLTPFEDPCLNIVKMNVIWKQTLRSPSLEECYNICYQERHL